MLRTNEMACIPEFRCFKSSANHAAYHLKVMGNVCFIILFLLVFNRKQGLLARYTRRKGRAGTELLSSTCYPALWSLPMTIRHICETAPLAQS